MLFFILSVPFFLHIHWCVYKEKDQELSDHCRNQDIQWKFTSEHAPHFGGLWEVAVKFQDASEESGGRSKAHLRGVSNDTGTSRSVS